MSPMLISPVSNSQCSWLGQWDSTDQSMPDYRLYSWAVYYHQARTA